MPVTGSGLVKLFLVIAVLGMMRSYTAKRTTNEPLRTIELVQEWALQPGDSIEGYTIAGGLGDISIVLAGGTVQTPLPGQVQPTERGCVIFSSDQLPAYLFRLCGLKQPRLGDMRQGEVIGTADYVQVATLRKQPNGKWAFVETSSEMLSKVLKKP